jgi:hypothetical protein
MNAASTRVIDANHVKSAEVGTTALSPYWVK